MNMWRAALFSPLFALQLAAIACGREPVGWTPVLEETSMGAVRSETERVAELMRVARQELPTDVAAATAALESAERAVGHLLEYYLPLVEARERAYNAYRLFYLGREPRVGKELDEVERLLLRIASSDGQHMAVEIEHPLKTLSDARVAIVASPEQAPALLERLASSLNLMVVKGGLALEGP